MLFRSSLLAPTSVTATGGTVNWSSSNQSAYSISGGFSVPYTTSTAQSRAITGLSSGTSYTYTVTVTSSDGHTASATASGSTLLVTTSNLSTPSISQITGGAGALNVYLSGLSGPPYQVYWYTINRTDIQTVSTYDASGSSSPVLVTNLAAPSSGYTYYFWGRSAATTGTTGVGPSTTLSSWSSPFTWTAPIVTYTVTYNATANGGTVSPTSVQVNSGSSTTLPTASKTGNTFNGWYTASTGGTLVGAGGATYTPTATVTLYAQFSVPFTTPTCAAPSLAFERNNATSLIRWYCDYPTPSGSVQSITGMQYEIRTLSGGGGTLLISSTRAYPGAFTYPYSAGGTIWAFAMGTAQGDITFTTALRYGRARVVMLGTNGSTYYGAWTIWI